MVANTRRLPLSVTSPLKKDTCFASLSPFLHTVIRLRAYHCNMASPPMPAGPVPAEPIPVETEPTNFEDELLALALALEELQPGDESDSGPNSQENVALEAFHAELLERFTFMSDLKLAGSISGVFNSDERVLAEINRAQAEKDN